MRKKLYADLLGEKNTTEVFKYMKETCNLKGNIEDLSYLTYINNNINIDEYYNIRNIRSRIYNFTEEYIFLRNKLKENVGMLSISANYDNPVLSLNVIHINKEYLGSLEEEFMDILGFVKDNILSKPSKIRATLNTDNYRVWKDTFIKIGFKKEASRLQGDYLENSVDDYVIFYEGVGHE